MRSFQTTFESGGKTIRIDCFVPDGDGRFPAIISLHGSGGNYAGISEPASLLANRGYGVYVLHYFDRTGTAKSNMFDNKPTETQYYYTDGDSTGASLNGDGNYQVTFAPGQDPPVNGFWSLTLYNEHHFFNPNALKRYSLGTKNKTLKRNADGSLTLYAGAKSPGKDKESNWLPAPTAHFSLYLRAYWGKQPILDGSWQPPSVRKAG